jgi:hypothetical protein
MDIKEIKESISAIKSNYPPEQYTMLRNALDNAIIALELQIHKQPIIESWSPARCPNCYKNLSEFLGDGYYKHYYGMQICECGQKLTWEGVK